MLSAEFTDKRKGLLEAFKKFKIGFLLAIIFGIISFPNTILNLLMFLHSEVHELFFFLQTYSIVAGIINFAGGIVVLYFLCKGFEGVEKYISGTTIGKWGVVLKFIALIGSFIVSLFIIPKLFGALVGKDVHLAFLEIYGLRGIISLIGLIGAIFLAVALYHIGDHYNETLIIVGAILYIFLAWISAILLFIGFRNLEEKMIHEPLILPPPPPL